MKTISLLLLMLLFIAACTKEEMKPSQPITAPNCKVYKPVLIPAYEAAECIPWIIPSLIAVNEGC